MNTIIRIYDWFCRAMLSMPKPLKVIFFFLWVIGLYDSVRSLITDLIALF